MSYDSLTTVCQILNDDIMSLSLLTQTNKEMMDIVLNNTSYLVEKENKINEMNFKKIIDFTREFASSKVKNDSINATKYNIEIDNMTNCITSSHLDDMNAIICENYFDCYENNPPKFIAQCLFEEAKMIYSIMKKIDMNYKIKMIYPGENDILPGDMIEEWLNEN